MALGSLSPAVRKPVPSDTGRAWIDRLAANECPAFTTRRKRRAEYSGASHDPIVWVEAKGCNVLDADGNRYVDLTGGFGVALLGHGHPAVVAAVQAQAQTLLHALGDLHPSDRKISILERLCALGPWDKTRGMLSLSGSDAITAALKTAALATGRSGVLAFEGSYHGLGYGPLSVSSYSERFRQPFEAQLNPNVQFAPWPSDADDPRPFDPSKIDWRQVGAVLFEPVQGRNGVRIPPPGFLAAVESACRDHGAVLIADEIFSGLGRCGSWWRSVAEGCTPDILCVGKALGGGLPISACLGSEQVMSAWGSPDQQAIHTGTFYGNPLSAAAALATLDVIETEDLVSVCATRGASFAAMLQDAKLRGVRQLRQVGLMLGVELSEPQAALRVSRELLEKGYLVLPAGQSANVIQLLPPVSLSDARFSEFTETFDATLRSSS